MNLFKRTSKTAKDAAPAIYEGGRDLADRATATGRELASRASAGGQVLANRATEFYRKNPKTVGAAALLGAVAVLGLVKNRGIRRV